MKTLNVEVKINNVTEYAIEKYNNGGTIVARFVDGEWWFYGCYAQHELDIAQEAVQEIDGYMFKKEG